MKSASNKRKPKAAGSLRHTGSFTFHNEQVDILINPKTGEAAFEIAGKRVEDEARLEELISAFCAMNHTHPKQVSPSKKESEHSDSSMQD